MRNPAVGSDPDKCAASAIPDVRNIIVGMRSMSESQFIVNFSDFLDSAPGRYVLAWEQRLLDSVVADIFGYHAMQLGMPQIDTLRENRMPLRCIALDCSPVSPIWIEH